MHNFTSYPAFLSRSSEDKSVMAKNRHTVITLSKIHEPKHDRSQNRFIFEQPFLVIHEHMTYQYSILCTCTGTFNYCIFLLFAEGQHTLDSVGVQCAIELPTMLRHGQSARRHVCSRHSSTLPCSRQ
jgi:hypothetical protein